MINWSSGTGVDGGAPVGFTGFYTVIATNSNYYYSSDRINFTLGSKTDITGTFTGYINNLTVPLKQCINRIDHIFFSSDFNVSTPYANQVLAYDSTSSKWINAITITAEKLKTATGTVTISSSTAPSSGQVLAAT